MNNILMVLTSHDRLGDSGEKTGFWLEEFAAPYYALKDMGAHITIASPLGGLPPLDPKSNASADASEANRRFFADSAAQVSLADSHSLSSIEAQGFDAILYPGGHGLFWDLVDSPEAVGLLETFYQAGKPCAFIGHAAAILRHARQADGRPLVQGKNVTGLSNSEEADLDYGAAVPFLLEDMLREHGAHYQKGDDWLSFVVTDGNLITGQNPASSIDVAKAVIKALTV